MLPGKVTQSGEHLRPAAGIATLTPRPFGHRHADNDLFSGAARRSCQVGVDLESSMDTSARAKSRVSQSAVAPQDVEAAKDAITDQFVMAALPRCRCGGPSSGTRRCAWR
jgi:hypothetical protein